MATTDIVNDDEVLDPIEVEDQAPSQFLNMSDDDMMNLDPSTLASGEADAADMDQGKAKEDEAKADDEAKAEDNKTDDVAGSTADASGEAKQAAAGTDGKADDAKKDPAAEVVDAKAKTDTKQDAGDGKAKSGDEGAKDESVAVDYEAQFKKLMAPFKANGKEIAPKSPEDAIALMQMGANYQKKMAGMKPHMATLRMLDNAGIKEDDLVYLIDLHKKDPAAINRLIVDSKIDPLDLSADKASEYKPGNHKVSKTEVELDEVIGDLEGSEHLARTLEVVSSKWDEASRAAIVQNPQVLTRLNDQMGSGIYDRIMKEIDSERTFGRLKGLSDIEAYQQVGDAINARKGFDDLLKGSSQSGTKSDTGAKEIVDPNLTKANEDKLKEKRKAASGSKTTTSVKALPDDFNPLKMSDADFLKM